MQTNLGKVARAQADLVRRVVAQVGGSTHDETRRHLKLTLDYLIEYIRLKFMKSVNPLGPVVDFVLRITDCHVP